MLYLLIQFIIIFILLEKKWMQSESSLKFLSFFFSPLVNLELYYNMKHIDEILAKKPNWCLVEKDRFYSINIYTHLFPDSSVGKESACNVGAPGWIPGLGRSVGEGIGYQLIFLGLPCG